MEARMLACESAHVCQYGPCAPYVFKCAVVPLCAMCQSVSVCALRALFARVRSFSDLCVCLCLGGGGVGG